MKFYLQIIYSLFVALVFYFSFSSGKGCAFNKFECSLSKKCIDRHQVRNGWFNCGVNDTSDEELPLPSCHPRSEFRCRQNGQCVERKWINQGVTACEDGTDEGGIPNFPCIRGEEIKCARGNCIPIEMLDQYPKCLMNGNTVQHSTQRKGCKNNNNNCQVETKGCGKDEFRCSNQQCISRYQVMDGFVDCENDETKNLITKCNDEEFTCHESGDDGVGYIRCLPRAWINDGLAHCAIGSDENVTSLACATNEWSCDENTKCLSQKQLCDGIPDCQDCSDETMANCTAQHQTLFFRCKKAIGRGENFSDAGIANSHCILRSYFCDGVIDCADESDEQSVGSGFKCRITRNIKGVAITRSCILPSSLLHDGFSDCDDGSDEIKDDLSDELQHFSCTVDGGSHVEDMIRDVQVCDGVFDCQNLVDECLCADELDLAGFSGSSSVCDDICYDYQPIEKYGDTHSVKISHNKTRIKACEVCPFKTMFCSKEGDVHQCISLEKICDGIKDCLNGKDELYCHIQNRMTFSNYSEIENVFNCPMPEGRLLEIAERYSDEIKVTAKRCDGVPECFGLFDECSDFTDDVIDDPCRLRHHKPEYCEQFPLDWWLPPIWKVGYWPSQLCDGIAQWEDNVDELYCDDTRYYCNVTNTTEKIASYEKFSIEPERVCDGHVDCNDLSDELNCSDHFYCLHSKHPLFVSKTKVLDGVSDCLDGSDECPHPDTFEDDPLSSREQLIKFPVFQVMIWIIGIIATLGNITLFIISLKNLLKMKMKTVSRCSKVNECLLKNKHEKKEHSCPKLSLSPLAKCNNILVLNLAIADFFTGVYLLIVASKSSLYSGTYCSQEMAWRSSKECGNIGSLILTTSLASVFTLVTLSSYRLFAALKPWKMKLSKVKIVVLWIFLIWTISLLIGLLPNSNLFDDVFVTSLYLTVKSDVVKQKPFFFPSHAVSKPSLFIFLKRACVLYTSSEKPSEVCRNIFTGDTSWNTLISTLNSLFHNIEVSGYFGYFSHHGVCLPALFESSHVRPENIHGTGVAAYTAVIMGVNFILFVYIAFGYSMVCYKSRKLFKNVQVSDHNCNTAREIKKVSKMHRRIARLVLTDFLCWVPVCIISFCSLAGVPTSAWLYSFTIVILLPINSALNPLLYSDIIANSLKNVTKRFKCFKRSQKDADELLPSSSPINTNFSTVVSPSSKRSSLKFNENAMTLATELNKEFQNKPLSKKFKIWTGKRSTESKRTGKSSQDCIKSNASSFGETISTYMSVSAGNVNMESAV